MNGQNNALGRHLVVEYYNCDPVLLEEPEQLERWMKEACRLMRATIVESCFHHFNPWGVSGTIIIAESHFSVHTWPEYHYAAVDLFTCGDIEPWDGFFYLTEQLKAEHTESFEMNRGSRRKIERMMERGIGEK